MKRREFIAGVGATAAWPFAVKAQQGESKKRIGVLIARPENDAEGQSYVVAFEQALEQTGWKPGRNVEIDYRWTASSAPLAETFASELVALRPDILVASSTTSVIAARCCAGRCWCTVSPP